jgi:hypothetical protein
VTLTRAAAGTAVESEAAMAGDASRPSITEPAAFDEYARARMREFLRWHVGFWVRYVPRRPDGSWPSMQQRESFVPRCPLEGLLARTDDAAVDYITDQLLDGGDLGAPPAPGQTVTEPEMTSAG